MLGGKGRETNQCHIMIYFAHICSLVVSSVDSLFTSDKTGDYQLCRFGPLRTAYVEEANALVAEYNKCFKKSMTEGLDFFRNLVFWTTGENQVLDCICLAQHIIYTTFISCIFINQLAEDLVKSHWVIRGVIKRHKELVVEQLFENLNKTLQDLNEVISGWDELLKRAPGKKSDGPNSSELCDLTSDDEAGKSDAPKPAKFDKEDSSMLGENGDLAMEDISKTDASKPGERENDYSTPPASPAPGAALTPTHHTRQSKRKRTPSRTVIGSTKSPRKY